MTATHPTSVLTNLTQTVRARCIIALKTLDWNNCKKCLLYSLSGRQLPPRRQYALNRHHEIRRDDDAQILKVKQQVNGMLIGIVLDLLWDGSLAHGARVFSMANYQVALSILPLYFAIALVLVFFIQETYQPRAGQMARESR